MNAITQKQIESVSFNELPNLLTPLIINKISTLIHVQMESFIQKDSTLKGREVQVNFHDLEPVIKNFLNQRIGELCDLLFLNDSLLISENPKKFENLHHRLEKEAMELISDKVVALFIDAAKRD